MPIINRDDSAKETLSPGTDRWGLVDGTKGAKSLSVAEVSLSPDAKVPTHMHPTEEAMVILEGKLEAILGDEVVNVTAGQTVLAPAGVKHGFVNRSKSRARLMAIFPTSKVERIPVD
jgi:quercetin dioxygenase-like cupin family protein